MSTAATSVALSSDDFVRTYGHERGVELIRGQVVRKTMPGARHGYVCTNASVLFGSHVKAQQLGRVMSNDPFVRTRPDPAGTLRGADLCYWSFDRLPAGPVPAGVVEVLPELVVEVRSPGNRWTEILAKVSEYLAAGVSVVVVLDPETESATVYRPDELQQVFHNGDTFRVPDLFAEWSTPVKAFFE